VLLLALVSAGCAVHYRSSRTGAEHLWGLGRLEFATNLVTTNLVAITTGSRIPGLCLQLGRDQFGLSLGYSICQQTCIVAVDQLAGIQPPQLGQALHWGAGSNGAWGLGHLHMQTVPGGGHLAVVTGRALAGLAAQAGAENTSFSLALDRQQRVTIQAEDAHVSFQQDAPSWPGFDQFSMQVTTLPATPNPISPHPNSNLNPSDSPQPSP
jgi:hypothetical protein